MKAYDFIEEKVDEVMVAMNNSTGIDLEAHSLRIRNIVGLALRDVAKASIQSEQTRFLSACREAAEKGKELSKLLTRFGEAFDEGIPKVEITGGGVSFFSKEE